MMMDIVTFIPTDRIPMTNFAWGIFFRMISFNKEAITECGLDPLLLYFLYYIKTNKNILGKFYLMDNSFGDKLFCSTSNYLSGSPIF